MLVVLAFYKILPAFRALIDKPMDFAVAGISVGYGKISTWIYNKTGFDAGFVSVRPDPNFLFRVRVASYVNDRRPGPLLDMAVDQRLSIEQRTEALLAILKFDSISEWVQPFLNELAKGGLPGLYDAQTPIINQLVERIRSEGGIRQPLIRAYADSVLSFMMQHPTPILRQHAYEWANDLLGEDAAMLIAERAGVESDPDVLNALANALWNIRAVSDPEGLQKKLIAAYRTETPIRPAVAYALARTGFTRAKEAVRPLNHDKTIDSTRASLVNVALAGRTFPKSIQRSNEWARIAAERKKRREDQEKWAFSRQLAIERAVVEEANKIETARLAEEEAARREEMARVAQEREEARRAELAQASKEKAERVRLAKEESRKKTEAARLAKVEAQKNAEAARLAKIEAEKKAEAARLAKAEAEKKAEAVRLARAEAQKREEEMRTAKMEDERKKAELARMKAEEEKRKREEEEARAEAKRQEEIRLAEAKKVAAEEEKRLAAIAKEKEEEAKRLAALKKEQEELAAITEMDFDPNASAVEKKPMAEGERERAAVAVAQPKEPKKGTDTVAFVREDPKIDFPDFDPNASAKEARPLDRSARPPTNMTEQLGSGPATSKTTSLKAFSSVEGRITDDTNKKPVVLASLPNESDLRRELERRREAKKATGQMVSVNLIFEVKNQDVPLYMDPGYTKLTGIILPIGSKGSASFKVVIGDDEWYQVKSKKDTGWANASLLTVYEIPDIAEAPKPVPVTVTTKSAAKAAAAPKEKEAPRPPVSEISSDATYFEAAVDGAPVFKEPSTRSDQVGALEEGVAYLGTKTTRISGDRWFYIDVNANVRGWVRGVDIQLASAILPPPDDPNEAEKPSASSGKWVVAIEDSVPVYGRPSITAKKIRTIGPGESFRIIDVDEGSGDEWYLLDITGRRPEWVQSMFVKVTKDGGKSVKKSFAK